MSAADHLSPGQFYHGSAARFKPGDMITPEGANRYYGGNAASRTHVFATVNLEDAKSYSAMRAEDETSKTHVYHVEPVGRAEPDHTDATIEGQYKAPALRVVRKVADVDPGEYW